MDRFIFQSNEADDQQPIDEILSLPIFLSDRIRHAVDESKSYKLECADVGKQVDHLSQMLRSLVRSANSTPSFYERPVRRIFTEVAKNLNPALTLVRKCRRRSIFRRFVTIVGVADFRKICNLLDVSIGDVKWLLSIFDGSDGIGAGGGIILSLPPIASNDPILAWVWSYIASLHLCSLSVKIEVAHDLSSLARDNDRNKKIIIEEGGMSPLLKLLKENSSPEAQIAAAMALFNLANDQNSARVIVNEHGVPIIVQVFQNSPIMVQIEVVKLIARMAEHDSVSQEGFARENVIGTLIALLNIFIDDDLGKTNKFLKQSIHSVVEINNQSSSNYSNKGDLSSSVWPSNRKESKKEPHESLLEFKTNCSGALWMLARGSVTNIRKITEAKGLFCLAKLIEREKGELLINCLMTTMEITAAAEKNTELRRAVFKTNSPAAKAIVDQLIRLIHESDNPVIKIPAIRAIGHLARTFPARQTQVIGPLVEQLGHGNPMVGTESVIALGKFTCPDNFLCAEHSKSIVEFEGVPPLLRLLRESERTQYHTLVLVCYLAMHAENSEPYEQARLLTALEGADNSVACQYSELRELVEQAICHLTMSHAGLSLPQRQSYSG